ncbi:hypothetical protein T03_10669 [Trichinella britovi]|uniref:Uncharacterized protein n=1 Tax=Trichinella britovi TaxID=45882 RepID=A0A0V1AP24_TRIBR|nr:hypothetical protein T03_10669 [Trichinella britovi]
MKTAILLQSARVRAATNEILLQKVGGVSGEISTRPGVAKVVDIDPLGSMGLSKGSIKA